jgi:ubiquinone/menaquinone biosynthesis C-methylase UbiE
MLQEDVPFLLGHLPKRRQAVLEIAAGTGRAAIPIAQAGHRVVGVDYDAHMLAIARRKRDSVGLGDRQLSLVHADALTLDLPRRFDWVVILFNTFLAFTTLAEQDALLQRIREHMKPKGRFWIDIFQPNLELLAQDESSNLDPCAFHVPGLGRTVYRVTDVRRDVAQQVQQITFRYEWFDDQGQDRHDTVDFPIAFVFPRELRLLLERNGLKLDRLYGNYDGSPLGPDSPRMIAVGRRAEA